MKNLFSETLALFFIGALFFSSNLAKGQEILCKASEANAHITSTLQYAQFEQYTRQFIQGINKINESEYRATPANYTIPVVFHVFGSDFAGKTVTEEVIRNSLQQVNDDFNGLNDDFHAVDPLYEPIRATIDIEFKLAKKDPQGNPTSGIIFYPNTEGVKNFGATGTMDSEIRKYAWDNYRYCNIYIMLKLYDDNETNYSGVAFYPSEDGSKNNVARIVYNGRYLFGNTDKEFSSTLTHEFGHYLNLIHTFEGGCQYPNDYVADTPPENTAAMGCRGVRNCEGTIVNGENYMGYSGSRFGCYKMFTRGQVNRMLAALQHPARKALWQPGNLIATGIAEMQLALAKFQINETELNDGSLDSLIIYGLNGVSFTQTNLIHEGYHFTLSELPEGITPEANVVSDTALIIHFKGKASNHQQSASLGNVQLLLYEPIFKSGFSSTLNTKFSSLMFVFNDPYITISCIPSVLPNNSVRVTQVELAGLVQPSGADRYVDRTDIDINVVLGESYPLNIKVATGNSPGAVHLLKSWIDWDENFVLTEDEVVLDTTYFLPESNKEVQLLFRLNIRKNTQPGTKIMRLLVHRLTESGSWLPCASYSKGEVEDYSLQVLTVLGLNSGNDIWLYPNPFNNRVHMPDGLLEVYITDTVGSKVQAIVDYSTSTIDFSACPEGIYMLYGRRNNVPYRKKLIKNSAAD